MTENDKNTNKYTLEEIGEIAKLTEEERLSEEAAMIEKLKQQIKVAEAKLEVQRGIEAETAELLDKAEKLEAEQEAVEAKIAENKDKIEEQAEKKKKGLDFIRQLKEKRAKAKAGDAASAETGDVAGTAENGTENGAGTGTATNAENGAAAEATEQPKEKKHKPSKLAMKLSKNSNKIAKFALVAGLAMLFAGVIGNTVLGMFPYAITVDGKAVCYVDNKEDAEAVIDKVAEDYKVNNTVVKIIDTDERLKIERSKDIAVDSSEVLDIDTAVETVKEVTQSDDFKLTVGSMATETREYVPTPNYKKDENALAGSAVIEEEGRVGSQEVAVAYTTVNGQLTDKIDVTGNITDKGEKATIVKGTLGLPEGADWRTYDGTPEANDGGVISVTAQTYDGKVRYVSGGVSLDTGVDCVGLCIAIYRLYGIHLSSNLRAEGRAVSYADAKPGDIICYSRHFGIYIGNGMQVDARSGGGVAVRSVASTGQSIVGVRRIID